MFIVRIERIIKVPGGGLVSYYAVPNAFETGTPDATRVYPKTTKSTKFPQKPAEISPIIFWNAPFLSSIPD